MMPIFNIGLYNMGGQPSTLLAAIQGIGLASNLKLCLDGGDALSYSSGQTWADRSGQGTDFYRGSGSGSDAADPTFNGNAGNPSSYWSFDGGDYFSLVAGSNPSWVEPFHKDGATFTIMAAVYAVATGATGRAFLSDNGTGSIVGFTFGHSGATPNLFLQVGNASGAASALNVGAAANMTANAWNIIGVSVNENGGASAGIFSTNGTTETFNPAYTSPSAASASSLLKVAADGVASAGSMFASGSRLGFVCALNAALTAGQMQSIFGQMRGRYGI